MPRMSLMVPGGMGPWILVGIATGWWWWGIQFINSDRYSGWEVQPSTSTGRDWEAGDRLKGVLEVLTVYAPTVCGAWGWPWWRFPGCKGEPFLWNFDLYWLTQWLPFWYLGHRCFIFTSRRRYCNIYFGPRTASLFHMSGFSTLKAFDMGRAKIIFKGSTNCLG